MKNAIARQKKNITLIRIKNLAKYMKGRAENENKRLYRMRK